jgi:Flp pilus assembly protein TadG
VEFAVVAPVFLLLVFGMIEIGRVIMVQQVLTNASREGARAAVLDGSTISSVNTTVTTYLTTAGLSGGSVSVMDSSGSSVEPSTLSNGIPITVRVSIPFSNVSLLSKPWFFSSSATLKASTVMLRETVQ